MLSSRPTRLLVITSVPPRAPSEGGDGNTVIIDELLRARPEGWNVTLAFWGDSPVAGSFSTRVDHLVMLPYAGKWSTAFRTLMRFLPSGAVRRSSRAARHKVRDMAADADVVLLHDVHCFDLTTECGHQVVVHEIDPLSLFYADLAKQSSGLQSLRGRWRSYRYLRLERRASTRAKAYVVVSPADATELGEVLGRPVMAIPIGIPPVVDRDVSSVAPGRLVFAGILSYGPNVASAAMLVDEVLPLVRAQCPDASVLIAGHDPAPEVRDLATEGVEILASPADVDGVLSTGSVAVFPGGYGRGIRGTVLRTLSCGVPIVASPASGRGIPAGPHIAVAESAAEVAASVVKFLENPLMREEARESALRLARQWPSWKAASLDLWNELAEVAAGELAPR